MRLRGTAADRAAARPRNVTQLGEPGFDELQRSLGFDSLDAAPVGARAIVTVHVERVADSCGYGVPLMRFEGTRRQQMAWYESLLQKLGPNGVLDYAAEENAASLDRLPGLEVERLPSRA